MTGVRRVSATGLILIGSVGCLLLSQSPAGAHAMNHHHTAASHKIPKHIGPARSAWFDITRATAAAPGLPQPGLKPTDLVVAGVTVTTSQLPFGVPVKIPDLKQVAALAALTYRIPKGATVSTLSLKLSGLTTAKVDGALPGGVSPVACQAMSSFKKGAQQVGSKAPSYDCKKRTAIGQLSADKSAIQFPGIGRLTRGRRLSFVILPGTVGLERLVFSKPDKTSLHLLSFGGTTPPAVPTTPPSSASPPKPTSNPPPPGSTLSGSSTNLPPVNTSSVPKDGVGVATPQVAGAATPTPTARVTAVKPLNDARARAAAIALLVGLVVATAWLTVTDRAGRTWSTLRILRAIQAGGPLPELPAAEWGIGRFKSTRSGPPPTI